MVNGGNTLRQTSVPDASSADGRATSPPARFLHPHGRPGSPSPPIHARMTVSDEPPQADPVLRELARGIGADITARSEVGAGSALTLHLRRAE